MSILSALWGKTIGGIVGIVGILFALLGLRHSIRKTAQKEMSNEIKERTLERVKAAESAERGLDGLDRDGIIDKLREQGHIRDGSVPD